MQVDPSPMNVGDGGPVSRESSGPGRAPESMVGNPQQMLPLELRGDLPLGQQNKLRMSTDCKVPGICSEAGRASNSNHCPEVPPSQPRNNTAAFGTDPLSVSSPDRTEVPKAKADGAGVYPAHHWPCSKKAGAEDAVNSAHAGSNTNKKSSHSPGHAPPVISLPPGFQCSTLFKPGQPIAFLPSHSFSSPLCKITLPPGLGQIAALREATTSQFQKDCPAPTSGTRLKTYPYHFAVSGAHSAEKKTLSSSSKSRSESASNAKSCKGEHKSTVSSTSNPALSLPVHQATQGAPPPTRYTISPTAAICCSSALASITTQSRLLSLVEKCPPYRGMEKTPVAYLKPKTPSSSEEHNTPCPPEARDVPLDLSSKSKRQKSVKDSQNSQVTPAERPSAEPHQKSLHSSKRPQTASVGSASSCALLPDTQRNGAVPRSSSKLTNHHSLESCPPWGKASSQGPLNSLAGTYVGVASPILASTLRSKDGKSAAFVEDIQTFAKQETISIIDQGEQLGSRGKKSPYTAKGTQQNKGIKHSACSTPAAQQLLSTPLFVNANSQSPRKSLGGKAGITYPSPVIKSLWQQPSVLSQGMSTQKRSSPTQTQSKVKNNAAGDAPLFHSPDVSPTKLEEKMGKSPLSNLESIVKQKALETTALTAEHYCNLNAAGLRRPEGVGTLNRCQNLALQPTATAGFTTSRSSEPQDSKPDRICTPTETTKVVSRKEASTAPVPKEKNHEKPAEPSQHLTGNSGYKSKLISPKKKKTTSAVKAGRKDSKLAKELEKTTKEEPAAQTELSPNSGLDTAAPTVRQTQTTTEGDGEKKASGAKEDVPFKAKVPVSKPPKTKKPTKEKVCPEMQKKSSATLMRKQQEKGGAAVSHTSKKKKKDAAHVVEKSQQKERVAPAPELEAKIRKGKTNSVQVEHSSPNKTGCESRPVVSAQGEEEYDSFSSAARPSKRPGSREGSSHRPRRGRRRTDEALLRDWSFASPPTPPTPPETPPSPPAPSPAPTVPLRRPRGRPRLNPLPEDGDADKIKVAQGSEGGDAASAKKRKRCRNRKYQNGEYIIEKDKAVDREQDDRPGAGQNDDTEDRTTAYPRLSATPTSDVPGSDVSPRRTLYTRSGSVRRQESPPTPDLTDKPPGKRKFKSKHLCETDEHKKIKTKRGLVGKRPASMSTDEDSPNAKKPSGLFSGPKASASPGPKRKGCLRGGTPDSAPSRPVPPEVRRLIVNKNAGETLLQRAARLGYQEVVLYCLEKDVREVNRRDNAGYTALHEACARGWTHIVQVLLKHGADVNCSAQDGTRPIHDAVAADDLAAVWMLLNHGADPTLATYSGQTAVKLAQSASMKTFLKEYFTDLEGRVEEDPGPQWDFYSSSVFETDQEACWDFLLSQPEEDSEERQEQGRERDGDADCLMFEFSSEPLLPCYHIQVSLTQGFCNWFLLTDVLKRLKVSARIFRARYPQFEVVGIAKAELWKQVSLSQTCTAPDELRPSDEEEDGEEQVELVRCVPELQGLLGSSIQLLLEDEDEKAALCS